jgi:hypothetical protein
MIVSFYNEKVPIKVIEHQRKVFEHFGQTINQIKPEIWQGHGGSIDTFLKNNDWEWVIIFDIDCIPLNNTVIPEAIDWIRSNIGLFSVAQKASHIENSIIYASPAFIGFSKNTFELLGKPSFTCTKRSDCAGELTYLAIEEGFEVKLMYPISVEKKLWPLRDGEMFGLGTNYENKIYHQFYSRNHMSVNFYSICNQILNNEK